MNWYLKVLKQYADFSGRARRKEYWMFALFNMIFIIVAMILDNVLGLTVGELPYGVFYLLYALVVLIPGLAVGVRRLHDVGKSGWMILIALIPLIGTIWLLVLMVTDSIPGDNEYGANPKESYSNANDSSTGDTLILIAGIWMCVSRLFWTIIPKFIDNYYSTEWLTSIRFKSISAVMVLSWSVVPICLAFAVKNKSKQIALFIIGGVYFLHGLYEIIMIFIN